MYWISNEGGRGPLRKLEDKDGLFGGGAYQVLSSSDVFLGWRVDGTGLP